MMRFINLRDGAVLDRNNGMECEDYLEIIVEGIADQRASVTVNGMEAERHGAVFCCGARLSVEFNEIVAKMTDACGVQEQAINVVWDRKSFKRYGFFIDDCIFTLTDIHRHGCKSIFDHFFLNNLRKLHRQYGTKFVLNLFYRNDHSPFVIKDFPDLYKGEWRDNSDWLKLSFHAYSEFPARPYKDAMPQKLAEDYDLVENEIARFAGDHSFQPPIVIHWTMIPGAGFRVLRERGVKVLVGKFAAHQERSGKAGGSCGLAPAISYQLDTDKSLYLDRNKVLYDFERGFIFAKSDVFANQLGKDGIVEKLNMTYKNEAYKETLVLATHEQYSFAYYHHHIPDHHERMEVAIRSVTDRGYTPVFLHEGFLGNTCGWPTARELGLESGSKV